MSAPSSVSQVLDFVQNARSKGIMAVVAVTRPFAFEGTRKLQAADKLIADLKNDADMVRTADPSGDWQRLLPLAAALPGRPPTANQWPVSLFAVHHLLCAPFSRPWSSCMQVVVVEQNKLCNGSGAEAMTVAQAIAIADRALVSTVQSIADAVVAPQLLHVVAGVAPLFPVQ